MCGLCGIFGEDIHWSTAGVNEGSSQRQRFFRVGAMNQVLNLKHLNISDASGLDYVLTSPTGQHAMVKEMGQLWQFAQDFLGQPIDPLDDSLIQAYQEKTDASN